VDLDHVALATADAGPTLQVLVGELGGTVLSGGQAHGFRPVQVRIGDAYRGMTVELLEVWDAASNDFLARFLARHGDGPHHLTVKVDDFDAALEQVAATGRTPVGVNRDDPNWMEAFIMPAEAFGTVVQLAAQAITYDFPARFAAATRGDPIGEPAWWPTLPARSAPVAVLDRVVLRTPELDEAVAFFGGLLEGREEHATRTQVDLVWPGGGRLRVEAHDGPRGIDRLELAGPAAARVLAGTRFVGT
jgi:catechol 2,3-dioxygenase-like lactoylglutathione lyase family enzyme